MPQYISLLNYTDQGIKDMKNVSNRLAAARQAMESAGGKLISFHLTLGQYDAVVISELPDDETAANLVLAIAAQGNLRTTTMRAFSEEEVSRIVGKLP